MNGHKHLFEMVRMQLYNAQLTNYLSLLSDESLFTIVYLIICNDIGTDELKIYEAILNEIEYRKSEKELSLRKNK